jgi:hypothetical protein
VIDLSIIDRIQCTFASIVAGTFVLAGLSINIFAIKLRPTFESDLNTAAVAEGVDTDESALMVDS